MKLISMTEFVLQQAKEHNDTFYLAHQLIDYAKFLSQKLELWMFVPCKFVGGVWVVLEEPTPEDNLYDDQCLKEYQEAKYRVLFEGFEYCKKHGSYSHSFTLNKSCPFVVCFLNGIIEDYVHYNLELTPTAQKQIGL